MRSRNLTGSILPSGVPGEEGVGEIESGAIFKGQLKKSTEAETEPVHRFEDIKVEGVLELLSVETDFKVDGADQSGVEC